MRLQARRREEERRLQSFIKTQAGAAHGRRKHGIEVQVLRGRAAVRVLRATLGAAVALCLVANEGDVIPQRISKRVVRLLLMRRQDDVPATTHHIVSAGDADTGGKNTCTHTPLETCDTFRAVSQRGGPHRGVRHKLDRCECGGDFLAFLGALRVSVSMALYLLAPRHGCVQGRGWRSERAANTGEKHRVRARMR